MVGMEYLQSCKGWLFCEYLEMLLRLWVGKISDTLSDPDRVKFSLVMAITLSSTRSIGPRSLHLVKSQKYMDMAQQLRSAPLEIKPSTRTQPPLRK
jgi:hypothetical protein